MNKKTLSLQPNKRKALQKQEAPVVAVNATKRNKKVKSRVDEIMQEMGI